MSHIVAISGWNIAIVAALVGGRVGTRARTAITLAAIVSYTLVAGASPSVNRAALMAAIGLTARVSGRSGRAVAALGWAVLILLLVDPTTVSDPGFELSGLATAGLIGWATPLTDRLRRIHGHALPGWLAESLRISLAAEACTLPVVLLIFGRLALVGPIANLAIVPLVPPAMAAGDGRPRGWLAWGDRAASAARHPPRPACLGGPRSADRARPSRSQPALRKHHPGTSPGLGQQPHS